MKNKTLVTLAIASLMVVSGCSGKVNDVKVTETEENTKPVVEQDVSQTEKVSLGIEFATADVIEKKLKAAGIAYTIKDETEDAKALPSKDAVLKSTKFKITGGQGTVRVTVTELNDVEKRAAVSSEINLQWNTVLAGGKTKFELFETEYPNLVVGITNEETDATLAASVKAALLKK